MAKTERLYAAHNLDGTNRASALISISLAMGKLEEESFRTNRDVLWDTLELGIERDLIDDSTFDTARRLEYAAVQVSALGVLR